MKAAFTALLLIVAVIACMIEPLFGVASILSFKYWQQELKKITA